MKIAAKQTQMSKEEKEAKRKENCERMASKRKQESTEKKKEIRKEDRERHARKRSQKSEEEKMLMRQENKEREAKIEDVKANDWESKSSADSYDDEKKKNLYVLHEKKDLQSSLYEKAQKF